MKGIQIFIFVFTIVALISMGNAKPLPENQQKRCPQWSSEKFPGACIQRYNGETCNRLCATETHKGNQGKSGFCHFDFPGFACFCFAC